MATIIHLKYFESFLGKKECLFVHSNWKIYPKNEYVTLTLFFSELCFLFMSHAGKKISQDQDMKFSAFVYII